MCTIVSSQPISREVPTVFTIGHSTRTLEQLVAILKSHGVSALADVRAVPQSRHVPQFNAEELAGGLAASGIEYVSLQALGGLRKPKPDSVNMAWRNAGFRGYADYMQTRGFRAGLKQLIPIASVKRTAIMCAEAVPWRCHRSLIADALIIRGWRVLDLMSERNAKLHKLTDFAKVEGTRITYPQSGDNQVVKRA